MGLEMKPVEIALRERYSLYVSTGAVRVGPGRTYTDEQKRMIRNHLNDLVSLSNSGATMNERQAHQVVHTVAEICLEGRQPEEDMQYTPMEAIALVTFINTCK